MKINILKDYTETPGGRFISDGPYSAEKFRKEILEPAFEASNEPITINLDGTCGFAASFLEEAFGGLARRFSKSEVKRRIEFISDEEPHLIKEILNYINDTND